MPNGTCTKLEALSMCEGGKCVVGAKLPHAPIQKPSLASLQLITLAISQANFTTLKTIPPILKSSQLSQSHPILTIPLNRPNSPNSSSSSSASQFFLFFLAIHNPVAMAMAMGVASLAVTAPKHSLATPRASVNRGGKKQGFLDWFRSAFDKESLSEMDDVMAKGSENGKSSNNGNGNGKAASAPKKDNTGAPPKKAGFNFFGKK